MTFEPSWLLLIWAGLAATLIVALVMAPLVSSAPRSAIWFFRPRRFVDGVLLAVLGIAIYPVAYGLLFDITHQATALVGAIFGLTHATLLVALAAIRRVRTTKVGITVLFYVAYGAVLGFIYASP